MDIAKDMKFKSYALISTFNKKNIISLCKIFNKIGIGIISTGSTANYIRNIGYECKTVSSFTKFKEILDGRVKTLHPKIYASILFKRKNKKQNLSFSSLNFPKIDYAYWLKNYSWEGFSSIRGMITTMINKKHMRFKLLI